MHVIINRTDCKLVLWYEMVQNINLSDCKNYMYPTTLQSNHKVIRIQIHIFQF